MNTIALYLVRHGAIVSGAEKSFIAAGQTQPLEAIPALREISLGEWEGVPFAEIKERFPKEFAARGLDMGNWRPPEGESFADCFARVSDVLTGILADSQGNVLLAGHAGVNRLILCSVLGIPLSNLHSIGQDYGCLNAIAFGPNRAQVKLLNYTPLASLPLNGISSRSNDAQTKPRKRVSASR